jgi:hypothetical protein
MRKYLSLIPFIVAVFIVACEPIEPIEVDPTPTQETSQMLDGMRIVNDDPHLQGTMMTDGVQSYPEDYTLYNDLHDVLGGVNEYTKYAQITSTDEGYFIDAVAKNGQWGLTTNELSLPPVCLVIRADIFASIVEMETYNPNIKTVAIVTINGKDYPLAEHDLTPAPGALEEYIWAMPAHGTVQVTVAIFAHHASAIPGTEIKITAIYAMIDETGGHCN